MRRKDGRELSLEPSSIKTQATLGGVVQIVPKGVPLSDSPEISEGKAAKPQRRSFLNLEDDHTPLEEEEDQLDAGRQSRVPMPDVAEQQEEDFYTSSLLRPQRSWAQDDMASSPVSATTLGAASLSTPASPASVDRRVLLEEEEEQQQQQQQQEKLSKAHHQQAQLFQTPDDREHGTAATPLRLCASLASIPEADQQQQQRQLQRPTLHSATSPIARRPISHYSNRSNSYSGDSAAWATPALTNGSSIASSRPTSSAFLTDTDLSNRVSVVESSFSGNSVESPTVETAEKSQYYAQPQHQSQHQHKPTLSTSESYSSALEVLTVNTQQPHQHLPLPPYASDNAPSPNDVGVGVTTEENENEDEGAGERDIPAPLVHRSSESSLHTRQLSNGGRQRSLQVGGSRSRSSSVAERIERVRLSSAGGSFADRARQHLQTAPHLGGSSISSLRAIGLQNVSPDTTNWCLRGIAAEQVVPALNNMMGMDKLSVLDISHCGLSDLPLSIQSFTSLKCLDISHNKLNKKTLPAFLASLTSLENLVADGCDLFSLHHPLSTLSSLRTLSVQNNQLKTLPSWFSQLESLRDLRLDGNPLYGIFADLAKPLLRGSLSSRSRVSSVTSLTQSMFQPQSSQPPSTQGSPLLSASILPLSESSSPSPFFASPQPSPMEEPSLSASLRERVHSTTASPALHASTNQGFFHGQPSSSSQAGLRKMRSSSDVKGTSAAHAGLQVNTKAFRNSAYADLPSPIRPTVTREDSAPAAPQTAPTTTTATSRPLSPPVAPPAASASTPRSPPPPAQPAAVKKKSSFFKKMGSFGRSRKNSSKSNQRPDVGSMAFSDDTPPPLPDKPEVSASITPSPPASAPPTRAEPPALSRPQSASSMGSSQTQMRLEQTPPAHVRNGIVALSEEDSEAEEIFDQSFGQASLVMSPEQQRVAGLQALMAYLRDLDDLMPRDTLPLHPAEGRPAMSRRNTCSRTSAQDQSEADRCKSPDPDQSLDSPLSMGSGKLKVDLAKRESVLNEIVATERSYVAGLQELVDIYVLPSGQAIKSATSNGKESIIPTGERKAVFSNIENLLQFHKSAFLPDLEAALAPLRSMRQSLASVPEAFGALLTSVAEELARVFVRHGAFLKMYHIYVNNFDGALARFQSWTAPSPPAASTLTGTSRLVASSAVAAATGGIAASDLPAVPTMALSSSQKKRIKAFLKQSRLDSRHTQMNCESYLLMPVQRIPRYRMLLEQLVSCTPLVSEEMGLQTNPVLSAAMSLASDLATELNEKKRESEGRTRLLYWQARIGNKFKSPLVQPHRLLLKESKMTISRTVKRSTEFAQSSGLPSGAASQSMFQVESLKVEEEHRSLIALLSSDILVLVVDNGASSGPVDLYAVIRLGRPANSQCATACGKGDASLRIVDPQRTILYLEPGSSVEAHAWARAINQQAVSF